MSTLRENPWIIPAMVIPEDTVRLVAKGHAGRWKADLLQSRDGANVALEIEGPNLYMELRLTEPGELSRIQTFLRGGPSTVGLDRIQVGSFCGLPVEIRRDEENERRYFLAVSADNTLLLTLAGADLDELNTALDDAAYELSRR